jgi:hypothetical protein
MQIDVFKENSLSFKITDTDGDNAVEMFGTILKKCRAEASKKGFKNMFTHNEKEFINEFTKIVLNED